MSKRSENIVSRRRNWTPKDVDDAVAVFSSALGLYRKRDAARRSMRVWCLSRFRRNEADELFKAAETRLIVVLTEDTQ